MSLRHQRRRRLLSDEALSPTDETPLRLAVDDGGEALARPKLDTAAARSIQSRALLNLLPTRYLAIAAVVLAAMTLLGLVALGHHFAPALTAALGAEQGSALDLAAPRNVGQWFASSLLLMASLTALFVYSLRRHRVDDYHGRYRVWILMAGVCLAGSLIETSGASAIVHAAVRRAAEWARLSDAVVWPATVATLLAVVGLRLLIEIRNCRLAVLTLVLAASGFAVSGAAARGWLGDAATAAEPLLSRSADLAAYIFILATFLLSARHALVEIVGPAALEPSDSPRPKRKAAERPVSRQSADATPRPASPVRTDLDPVAKSADNASTLKMSSASAPARSTSAASSANEREDSAGLSRAERRRQRRETRMAS